MTSRFEIDKQKEARTALLVEKTEAFERWLSEKHPEIRYGIALLNEVKEYMLDGVLTASGEDFEYALQNTNTQYMRQHVKSPADIKKDLVDEICGLLRSPNSDGRGGRYSEVALTNECKRLQTFSTDQLTFRRDEIVEKQRLQKLTAGEIRQELQASRPAPQAKVLPAEYSRERIHAMPSYEIKKLIRDWTANVVNDRLFGRN
jgi:hypothetical protein